MSLILSFISSEIALDQNRIDWLSFGTVIALILLGCIALGTVRLGDLLLSDTCDCLSLLG